MNPELIRQRRNLLLISSILILVQLAGISIERISILGTVLKIERMDIIFLSFWVVCFYQFLRYYQYLKNEDDLDIRSTISNKIYKNISAYFENQSGQKGRQRHGSNCNATQKGTFTWWYSQFNAEEPERIAPLCVVLVVQIQSIFHTCLNTPLVTDYILPVFIAVFPLAILILKNA